MNSPRLKYEGWLYGLAFLLALSLRLLQLGALPLTDAEAGSALQALGIAQGLKPALDPHPAYILLTSVLFFVFGSSNFLARLMPALAGSALVFMPLVFRERLKPRPSLMLAFFLAVEPGLLAVSRQAASSILAITFVLFAWGFWGQKRFDLAGAFAALALLGGPALWAGLLGLGITWAIRQAMEVRTKDEGGRMKDEEKESPTVSNRSSVNSGQWPDVQARNTLLVSFFGVLLLGGTLLFLAPNGLSAALASLPEYFLSWGRASGLPPERLLFSLLTYQPLAVILALIAMVRGWWNGSRRVIRLSLWMLIALLLAIFHPAHQVSDLAWVLIPLWALAALELARHLHIHPEERREAAGVALLTLLILVFAWFDLAGLSWTPIPSAQANLRIGLFFGSLFLLVLSLLLVAVGWSARTARFGWMWGVTLAFGIYTLAAALGAAGLRGDPSPELWQPNERPAQAGLLAETAADLSEWGAGDDNALPVVISGIDSPALEWVLRAHQITVTNTLDVTTSPPLVITPLREDPSLAAAYRGQDFVWRQTPAWETTQLTDWIRWITLRQMPQNGETAILWARNDLFLDAGNTTP